MPSDAPCCSKVEVKHEPNGPESHVSFHVKAEPLPDLPLPFIDQQHVHTPRPMSVSYPVKVKEEPPQDPDVSNIIR